MIFVFRTFDRQYDRETNGDWYYPSDYTYREPNSYYDNNQAYGPLPSRAVDYTRNRYDDRYTSYNRFDDPYYDIPKPARYPTESSQPFRNYRGNGYDNRDVQYKMQDNYNQYYRGTRHQYYHDYRI